MKCSVFYTPLLWVFISLPGFAGELANVSLYFSPHGGCQATIINAIAEADKTIIMASYTFSNKRIATALYNAAKRGVTVRVLLDRRQPTAHYSIVQDLIDHGLTVRIDRKETLMHMKLFILDGKTIICGSYNHTISAETRNAEILTVIVSKKLATEATANIERHWAHSDIHNRLALSTPTTEKKSSPKDCDSEYCPSKPSTPIPRLYRRRPLRWSN